MINKEYKVCTITPLNTTTPSFRTRRYFSHHSYKDNSLQNYPSLVGATFGTHINRGISLIIPLVHGRKKSTLARSLVQFVKFGAKRLAAVAASVPSTNEHIPFISKRFHHCPLIINKISHY